MKMTAEEVAKRLLSEYGVTGEYTMESKLAVLGLDSLDALELTMDVEEEFGCEITDEEIEALRTVGDFVEAIKRHGKGKLTKSTRESTSSPTLRG